MAKTEKKPFEGVSASQLRMKGDYIELGRTRILDKELKDSRRVELANRFPECFEKVDKDAEPKE